MKQQLMSQNYITMKNKIFKKQIKKKINKPH